MQIAGKILKPFRMDRLRRWTTLAILGWGILLVVFAMMFVLSPDRVTGLGHYLNGAGHWLDGEPLYRFEKNKGFVYSPLVAVFFCGAKTLPIFLVNILWRWGSALILLFGLWAMLRRGPFTHIPRHLHGLVFLLVLPIAAGNLDSGQANPLVIGLVMIAVAAASAERWTLCAIAAAGAFYWKVYPLCVGMLLVLVAPKKLTWRLLLALGVMALLPFLFQKPEYVAEQYRLWVSTRLADNRLEYPIAIAPLDLWYFLVRLGHLPISPLIYNVLRVASGAAIAFFCLYGLHRNWSKERILCGIFSFSSAWMLLCGPASESLAYLILAPAAAIAVVESFSERAGTPARALAWSGYACLLLAIVRVGFFHRWDNPWILALQPLGALFYLVYCLNRY